MSESAVLRARIKELEEALSHLEEAARAAVTGASGSIPSACWQAIYRARAVLEKK